CRGIIALSGNIRTRCRRQLEELMALLAESAPKFALHPVCIEGYRGYVNFADSFLDCLPRGGRILPRRILSGDGVSRVSVRHRIKPSTLHPFVNFILRRSEDTGLGHHWVGRILMNIPRWPKVADMRWYLGVRCQKCHVPILFALDR